MPFEVQDFFVTTLLAAALVTAPWTVPAFFRGIFGTARGISSFFS